MKNRFIYSLYQSRMPRFPGSPFRTLGMLLGLGVVVSLTIALHEKRARALTCRSNSHSHQALELELSSVVEAGKPIENVSSYKKSSGDTGISLYRSRTSASSTFEANIGNYREFYDEQK